MKQTYLLAVLMVMVLNCTAQSNSTDTSEDYAKGLQIYYTGQYWLAVPPLTKAIEANPQNYEAYLYRGNCYSYLHQFKLAEKDFNTASKHLKNNAELDFGYGYLYNEMGEYKKAIVFLDKATTINPKFALAYNTIGVSYQRLGNPRKAIESYTQAIISDSTLGIAYNNRGTAIYENQDIAAATNLDIRTAIKDFDKAIEFSPGLCLAWRNRGLAYSFIGKNDLALSDLDKAIKCENQNPTYYINRGTLLITMKRYPAAIDDFRHALNLKADLPEAYIYIGEAYDKEGSTQDAVINEMEATIQDKKYTGLADYNIARYYCLSKDKTLMMKYLELAKKNDYFKPIDNLANFLKDSEFLIYKNDKDFNNFRLSVRKNRL